MKRTPPEQELQLLRKKLLIERVRWGDFNEKGTSDPFWPDGCNINLTRNHILSYRNQIAKLCEENGFSLPFEYFLKVPPEVDDNYMANLEEKERVKGLREQGFSLIQKKQQFVDDGQLEFR